MGSTKKRDYSSVKSPSVRRGLWQRSGRSSAKQQSVRVLVRVLQGNRTHRTYGAVEEEACGNWFMWQQRLRYATICPLQAGEPGERMYKSVRVQRPMTQKLRSLKAEGNGHASSRRGRERIRPPTFLFLGPQPMGWYPPTLVRVDLYTQSADSNATINTVS